MEKELNNNPEKEIKDSREAGDSSVFEPFNKEKAERLREEYNKEHPKNSIQTERPVEKKLSKEAKKNAGEVYRWDGILSKLEKCISQPNATEIGNDEKPKWMTDFEDSFLIEAIVSDDYRERIQNGDEDMASPDEKRFLIEANQHTDYNKLVFVGEPLIDVNGFLRTRQDTSFPEETDFTNKNKKENKDIPSRINKALFELFGKNTFSMEEIEALNGGSYGFKHLDNTEYPNETALKQIFNELKTITDDIRDTKSQ